MAEIALGKPWADPSLSKAEREYAAKMHDVLVTLIRQGIRLSAQHFDGLGVPDHIFARAAIFSLVEIAADEAAAYAASREADDAQVERVSEAYAGLLLISVPKKMPGWRKAFANMVAAKAAAETRQ